ncbi:MAG: hypothetical protein IJM26_09540, partial [Lachnospiraceae bacterium]|nr:hypothetical protein [Lachnospiraceae bacterium]
NTYKTNPTEIVLSASKTLEVASGNNAPDVSGQYTLTLKDAEGNVIDTQVNPDGDGTKVDFSKLTYDKPGTYVYTVTEEGTVAGVTNGTTEYTVTVTVTDDGEGNLIAEVTGGSQVTNFVNTYSAEPVKYDPPVRKEYIIPEGLTGIDIEDAFEFTIEATSGPDGVEIPMPENTTIRNNSTFLKDGEVDIYEFGWITFTVPGTYVYTVKESGSVDGVTNDAEAETGKTITVVVTDDGEGHLVAEVTPSTTTLTFTNEYGADPVKAAPEAAKSLEGRKLRNGEFTFELVDENGEVIETVKNDADGAVKFSEIEYTMPGTYKYTIREVVGDNEKITYDTETISVTVTVTDNQHGKLVAEVTYGDKTIFVNTYTPDPTEANISVNKALTGRDLEAGEFTFTLTEVDENGNPVKKPVVTEKKADETTDKKADETTDEKAPEIQDSAAVVTGTGKAFVELETVGEKKIVETPETETEAETEVETEAETEVQTEAETEAQTEAEKETEAETEVQTEAETEAEKETEAETEAEKETETEKETEAEKEVEETKDEVIADDEKKAEEEEKAAEIETVEQVPGLTLTATNDAAGLVNFETISYDEAGTYYYKITEDSGSLGGVTYDTSEIIVKVVVTYDDVEGVYIAEVIYPEDKEFNNTYVPEPVKVQPEADKNLTGRDLNEGEFSFQLLDEDGNVVETVKNAADGSITFSEITYDKTGTYKYTIVEVNDGLGGVTYDEGKVEVTVTVTDNLKGNLVAEVLYSAKKTFDNTYVPAPVKIAPETKKTLEGRDLNADEFSFSLLDGDGNLVENVKNAADGTVKFSDITFDKVGTYTFTISETIGELGGVTYDTQTITVTVTVTDDLKGNLVAEISYSQTDGFTNTYEAEGEYTPSVTKALTGKALEEGQFTFELYDSEGNKLQTKTNAVSGKVTFDALSFTQEDVGKTFTYTIVEIDDEQKFVTYDKHVETLTVTVADNGDGTLDVTGTYSGGGSFKNTYQPPTYSIKVEKRTVSKPKDGKAYKEGETIKYEIVVTNDGEGTLKNVVVEDELTGAKWTIAELKPGESKTYTTSYVVTKADAEAKKVLNEVTAKADTEDPDKPYVEDDASVEDPTDVEKETPKTGDESKMLVWVIVMLSGMCGLVGMMLVDDKRKVRR